jgi:hypothetical protein
MIVIQVQVGKKIIDDVLMYWESEDAIRFVKT